MLAELGRGGMGRVLLGGGPDGRLVALKLVHEQFAGDAGFRARFSREVDASRAVSGAYTAAVVDADPDAPTPWLASVFVPGPSLAEAIQTLGPLTEQSALRLAAGLTTALIQIHRAGLVHRDLKPSNVLLAEDGPRVIDFGIVRAVDDDRADITRTGWLVGSPAFMSPEQAKGQQITPASDVFSLGSVVVAACTGTSPFTGATALETLNNVTRADPDLSGVPATIRRLVQPCLAKDPAERPTPADLLTSIGHIAPSTQPWPAAVHGLIAQRRSDLAVLLTKAPGEPTVVDGANAPTVAQTRLDSPAGASAPVHVPSVRRIRRRVYLSAAVGALVLAVVLAWNLWPSGLTEVGKVSGFAEVDQVVFSQDGSVLASVYDDNTIEVSNTETHRRTGQIIGPLGGDNDPEVNDAAFSPDGKVLVTVSRQASGVSVQQWNVETGAQIGQPLIVRGGVSALSQDGRKLAILVAAARMQVWDVAGRRQIAQVTGTQPETKSTASVFSPDGQSIIGRPWEVSGDQAGLNNLVLSDVGSQRPEGRTIRAPSGTKFDVYAFSPDGRLLVTAGTDETVRFWDVATRTQTLQPVKVPGMLFQAALSPDGRALATVEFSDKRRLRLWNVADGKQIGPSIEGVVMMAFSPDSHTFATAGKDHTTRLWSVPG
ncbi:WD40 repeat domain-containing serine/threonine protein kinase [Kribbella antiqua]|uniref:WD40 repeat domain-containing serine/threonine protein kinase n=1 Tax=Kribbella antiqua TaxID=2512217 RepID=UPI0018EE547D|nr:serine/threonine-protein kinase [Kribbella antiqua]